MPHLLREETQGEGKTLVLPELAVVALFLHVVELSGKSARRPGQIRSSRGAGRSDSINWDLCVHADPCSVERKLATDTHREVRLRHVGSRREGAGKSAVCGAVLRTLRNREVHLIQTNIAGREARVKRVD